MGKDEIEDFEVCALDQSEVLRESVEDIDEVGV